MRYECCDSSHVKALRELLLRSLGQASTGKHDGLLGVPHPIPDDILVEPGLKLLHRSWAHCQQKGSSPALSLAGPPPWDLSARWQVDEPE